VKRLHLSISPARKLAFFRALICILASVFSATTFAQSVQFDGAQRPVALGFYQPQSIAVDQYGNLFVADADTFLISEILAVNGAIPPNPTIRVLYRDIWNPEAIAVDKNGNVFFADDNDTSPPSGQTIKEILAVNGSIPASPTVVELGSGFTFPQGLAVDSAGNVYVADYYKSYIYEMLAVNGGVPTSPTILELGSGFSGPRGLTVDAGGNLYVADSGNHAVKEIIAVNGSIPLSPQILTLASNYCSPDGVSLDTQGNLYFSDYCNAAIYEILAEDGVISQSASVKTISSGPGLAGITDVAVDGNENIYAGGAFSGTQIPQVYPTDFGRIAVGAPSGVVPLMFTFIGPITIGSTSVVAQGAEGLDFADAGTGTCVAGSYFGYGYSVCTVNVTFTPNFAGKRSGAVILKDTSGNPIATGFMFGTGVAPLVNFAPRTQTTVVNNVAWSGGIALEASGNMYLSLPNSNQVVKQTFSDGRFVQSVLPTSRLSGPQGLAVDGSGSIFIADTGNGRVLREKPSPSGYVESTVASGLSIPMGVSVDGNGTVYIICENGILLIETPARQSYNNSNTIYTGLPSASAVAVDADGNIYVVSNTSNGLVLKEARSGNAYVQSTIPLPSGGVPTGVSLDGFGNLYVVYTDSGQMGDAGQVFMERPTSGGYVQTTIPAGGLNQPWAIANDPIGNIFIADSGNARVVKLSSSNPPAVIFASSTVGSTSADSPQTVTLTNVGNADLTFPIPASGSNPSVSTNFTLDENVLSACSVVNSGSSNSSTLAAGSSCVLPISFAPTSTGTLSGSLVLTDNNLNAAGPNYASQSISLSGTATKGTPTISWPTPAAINYGTALSASQLDATASVPGTFVYTPAAGSIPAIGTDTLSVTFTPEDTADYTSAIATVQLIVNPATIAAITSPASGSTLTGAKTTFTWTAASNATGYYVWVGTSPGTYNLANLSQFSGGTSLTVTLPTNGAAIYVRLWSVIDGKASQYSDYTYTEYNLVRAAITSPVNGSTLTGARTTFTWTAASNATGYYVWVGSSPGTYNLANLSQFSGGTSLTVTLPTNGAAIYVRLWSVIDGKASQYSDYAYTEATQ